MNIDFESLGFSDKNNELQIFENKDKSILVIPMGNNDYNIYYKGDVSFAKLFRTSDLEKKLSKIISGDDKRLSKDDIKILYTKESLAIHDIKHEIFSLEDMLEVAQYGFDMANESSETYVPVGNMLQHLMAKRKHLIVPHAWKEFRDKVISEHKERYGDL